MALRPVPVEAVQAPDQPPGPAPLNALTAIKLWENPCWFSFRLNYLGNHYNVPVYSWIERRYGLMRPDYVVLYSLGLREGVAAQDVCESSGFPKNTISRAVNRLLRRKLIERERDRSDQRRLGLRLTPLGRAIFDETLQALVERERTMLSALTSSEQAQLSRLMARLVTASPSWPAQLDE